MGQHQIITVIITHITTLLKTLNSFRQSPTIGNIMIRKDSMFFCFCFFVRFSILQRTSVSMAVILCNIPRMKTTKQFRIPIIFFIWWTKKMTKTSLELLTFLFCSTENTWVRSLCEWFRGNSNYLFNTGKKRDTINRLLFQMVWLGE